MLVHPPNKNSEISNYWCTSQINSRHQEHRQVNTEDIKFFSAWEYGGDRIQTAALDQVIQFLTVAKNMHVVYLAPEETTFGGGGTIISARHRNQAISIFKDAVQKQNVRVSILVGRHPDTFDLDSPYVRTEHQYSDDILLELQDIVDIYFWPEFFMLSTPRFFINKFSEPAAVYFWKKTGEQPEIYSFNKLFSFLVNRPHDHRCIFMEMLVQRNLHKENLITWNILNETHDFDTWDQHQLFDPCTSYDENGKFDQFAMGQSYHETLIDVVSESTQDILFWTEKTVRPMVFLKPFVIVGAQGINTRLRDFGFQLFEELFDYEFDNLYYYADRAKGVADQLSHLQQTLSVEEYADIYRTLQPKLVHNAKILAKIMTTSECPFPSGGDLNHYRDIAIQNRDIVKHSLAS